MIRLLNITTLELKEFFDKSIPPYAIWSEEEAMDDELHAETGTGKKGYKEIGLCCAQALKDGWS